MRQKQPLRTIYRTKLKKNCRDFKKKLDKKVHIEKKLNRRFISSFQNKYMNLKKCSKLKEKKEKLEKKS